MIVLAMDTSSVNATVALSNENKILGEYTISSERAHSQFIMPMLDELLKSLSLSVKDVDVFAFLNGEIDGLETAVDIMIRYVESLEKPIKDKNVRKKIDKELERLEKEYKTISDMLEKHKEDDPEKYEACACG